MRTDRPMSLALALVIALLWAPDARELIERGNERLRRGEPESAVEAYRRAAEANPKSSRALYNQGCALLKIGRLQRAADLFRRAREQTDDPALAGAATHNRAIALHRQAQPLIEQREYAEAIRLLRAGASLFRDAYKLNPDESDAARNVEAVNRRIHRLRQNARENRRRFEQISRMLEDLAERQRRAGEPDDNAEHSDAQPEANSAAGTKEQTDGDRARERQRTISAQTDQAMHRMRRLTQRDLSSERRKRLDEASHRLIEASRDQRRAQRLLERRQMERARASQRRAAERLRRAARALADTASQSERVEGVEVESEASSEPREQSAAIEASQRDRLLRHLLEKDRLVPPPSADFPAAAREERPSRKNW